MGKKRAPAKLLSRIASERRQAFEKKGKDSPLGGYNAVIDSEARAADASLREFEERSPATLTQLDMSTGKTTTFSLSKRDRMLKKRQDKRGRRR